MSQFYFYRVTTYHAVTQWARWCYREGVKQTCGGAILHEEFGLTNVPLDDMTLEKRGWTRIGGTTWLFNADVAHHQREPMNWITTYERLSEVEWVAQAPDDLVAKYRVLKHRDEQGGSL